MPVSAARQQVGSDQVGPATLVESTSFACASDVLFTAAAAEMQPLCVFSCRRSASLAEAALPPQLSVLPPHQLPLL